MNTPVAEDVTVRKFHTSLNVSDLVRSVAFYRALFGSDPAKERPDYAKFELADPPLVLSLIPGRPGAGGNLNHVGLRVRESEELVQIQHRLEAAGIPTRREDGVECCYAKQTRFWVTDPDHALWEIYIFHEDIDEHSEDSVPAVAQLQSFAQDVPRERIIWRHQLPELLPERIPHGDNSVHEVLFEGTVNAKIPAAILHRLLTEAFRVLRPGGEFHLHGLAADNQLPDQPLDLPGPAALVQHVPTALEAMSALRHAGFVEVRFEKLSKPYFEVAGISLREILLLGRKPGYRPRAATHAAVYLGPLSQVTDDFGNVFPRGQRVALNIHDWQVLRHGPVSGQFLLLEPPPH